MVRAGHFLLGERLHAAFITVHAAAGTAGTACEGPPARGLRQSAVAQGMACRNSYQHCIPRVKGSFAPSTAFIRSRQTGQHHIGTAHISMDCNMISMVVSIVGEVALPCFWVSGSRGSPPVRHGFREPPSVQSHCL